MFLTQYYMLEDSTLFARPLSHFLQTTIFFSRLSASAFIFFQTTIFFFRLSASAFIFFQTTIFFSGLSASAFIFFQTTIFFSRLSASAFITCSRVPKKHPVQAHILHWSLCFLQLSIGPARVSQRTMWIEGDMAYFDRHACAVQRNHSVCFAR